MKMQQKQGNKNIVEKVGRADTTWLQNLLYSWNDQKSIELVENPIKRSE